jgi:hypothetical protein
MPLDFPPSPTNGQAYQGYVYSTTVGAWQAKPSAQSPFYTSDTPPSNPVTGDSWFNTNDGTMYIYVYDGNTYQWVEHRSEIARSQVGLVPIVPTSVAVGSGTGSVNASGLFTFTGASTVTMNGIFTASYRNYKIIYLSTSNTAGASVNFRFAQTGTATTATSWVTAGYYYGTTGSGVLTPSSGAVEAYIGGLIGTGYSNLSTHAEITISDNRCTSLSGGFPNGAGGATVTSLWNGAITGFDGFRLSTSSGNWTGTMKVYGYN